MNFYRFDPRSFPFFIQILVSLSPYKWYFIVTKKFKKFCVKEKIEKKNIIEQMSHFLRPPSLLSYLIMPAIKQSPLICEHILYTTLQVNLLLLFRIELAAVVDYIEKFKN